jgi:outer membrane immunogenic protein
VTPGGRSVKKLLLVGVAGMLCGAPALAAPPTAPMFNWTGFYIGGHVGGGWSADWSGMTNPLPSPTAFGALPLSFSQKGSGVIAGGQIGYNWQFAPSWVLGIEADLSRLHIHTSSVNPALTLAGTPFVGAADCPGVQICTAFMTRDLDRLGTVRGRVGYAWERWLAYLTGGFAYGRVSFSGNYQVCCQHPVSFTDTKTGSTIGGGLEYALPGTWGNWTIKGEYLFVRLGSATGTVPQMSPPDPRFAVRYDWNQTNIHIVRFGLNYKFN